MNLHYTKAFTNVLACGIKKHTIRRKEAKTGCVLHHIIYPYHPQRKCILENVCVSCQGIKIKVSESVKMVWVDGFLLTDEKLEQLVHNDGFDCLDEFWSFFKTDFEGYIIHWTNLRY